MNRFLIVMALFGLLGSGHAQSEFSGHWSLVKTVTDGMEKKESTRFHFKRDGVIFASGFEMGQWQYHPQKKEVELQTIFDEAALNGIHKVDKLSGQELVFSKDGHTYFFERIDLETISRTNKSSGLMGTWKLDHPSFDDLFLKFELPNTFTFVSIGPYSKTSDKGEWAYTPKTKELHLNGVPFILNGSSIVTSISDRRMTIDRPQENLIWTKVDPHVITWLNFSLEDIIAAEESPQTLPESWLYDENFVDHLNKLDSLVYDQGVYNAQVESLIYSTVLKKVKADIKKQSVSISNILMTKTDTLQFSENYKGNLMNSNNPFFPEEEPDHYRVIGSENIDGYQCTVVECFLEDTKIRYWMINNQPGVYAKIIKQQDSDNFGEMNYTLLHLTRTY